MSSKPLRIKYSQLGQKIERVKIKILSSFLRWYEYNRRYRTNELNAICRYSSDGQIISDVSSRYILATTRWCVLEISCTFTLIQCSQDSDRPHSSNSYILAESNRRWRSLWSRHSKLETADWTGKFLYRWCSKSLISDEEYTSASSEVPRRESWLEQVAEKEKEPSPISYDMLYIISPLSFKNLQFRSTGMLGGRPNILNNSCVSSMKLGQKVLVEEGDKTWVSVQRLCQIGDVTP